VSSGGADHSYGIQVAQMAGLPAFVTSRAKQILENLEGKELTPYEIKKAKLAKFKSEDKTQFSLFEIKDDSLRNEISGLKLDNLTPIEALNKLNELKKKIDNG
jgi:DNA mismatch repair protein MutS